MPIPEKVTEKKETELSRKVPIHIKFKVCLSYFVHDLGKKQLIALLADLSKTFHPLIHELLIAKLHTFVFDLLERYN